VPYTGSGPRLDAVTPVFLDQIAGTIGAPQRVVVKNTGNAPLHVSAVRIEDADGASAGDFALADEACTKGAIAPPAGEKGDQGDAGPAGPAGPQGPQGEKGAKGDPGRDAQVTCKIRTGGKKQGHHLLGDLRRPGRQDASGEGQGGPGAPDPPRAHLRDGLGRPPADDPQARPRRLLAARQERRQDGGLPDLAPLGRPPRDRRAAPPEAARRPAG
jgi:hypothetical protein